MVTVEEVIRLARTDLEEPNDVLLQLSNQEEVLGHLLIPQHIHSVLRIVHLIQLEPSLSLVEVVEDGHIGIFIILVVVGLLLEDSSHLVILQGSPTVAPVDLVDSQERRRVVYEQDPS